MRIVQNAKIIIILKLLLVKVVLFLILMVFAFFFLKIEIKFYFNYNFKKKQVIRDNGTQKICSESCNYLYDFSFLTGYYSTSENGACKS